MRFRTYILAEIPLGLAVGLTESSLEGDLLILALLGILIDKRSQERLCFL